jgi:hypothetical protein
MSWIITVAVLIMYALQRVALIEARRLAALYKERMEHYRDTCIRAEHTLEKIAGLGEVEAFTTSELIADKFGVDKKSQLP